MKMIIILSIYICMEFSFQSTFFFFKQWFHEQWWGTSVFCFVFKLIYFYLFLAVLGLRFCVRASSSCGKWGPLFIAVHGPLTIAASLVAEHRLQTRRLSSRGSRAQLLRGMWYLPRPGLEPVSPVLAGRFSTTASPGKPSKHFWIPTLLSLPLSSSPVPPSLPSFLPPFLPSSLRPFLSGAWCVPGTVLDTK